METVGFALHVESCAYMLLGTDSSLCGLGVGGYLQAFTIPLLIYVDLGDICTLRIASVDF